MTDQQLIALITAILMANQEHKDVWGSVSQAELILRAVKG